MNLPKKSASALFLLRDNYLSANKNHAINESIDKVFLPLFSFEEDDGINGVYIPPVIMENEIQFVREKLNKAKNTGILYALVGNISHISLAKEFGFLLHDHIQWLHHLWHCIYIPGRYISEVLSDTSGKEALSRYI